MSNALFPLSVSNELFSSARYLNCLDAIPVEKISSCTFLIADRLQIYNHSSVLPISEVLASYNLKTHRLERGRWVRRIIDTLQQTEKWCQRSIEFNVIGMDEVLDATFFRIYRGLRLLFSTSERFRRDVNSAARDHVGSLTESNAEKMIALSSDYIIEEIAVNVRVRMAGEMLMEFYPGKYSAPLTNLYSGQYDVSPFELYGVSSSLDVYRFFSFCDALREWQEISSN